jgi:glyoxylase-like metal-dependent hydrolase (beta-lactamase superfamily II)
MRSSGREFPSIAMLFPSLALLVAQTTAPVNGCDCHATNAHYNIVTTPKSGYDYVPIVEDDSLGLYVIYSAKQNESNTGIAGTSCIYVLPLTGGEVLVFGGGFGDTWYIPGGAFFNADYDAAHVREAIGGCLKRTPSLTPLRFVAPHGHPDHITVAFIKALERAGFPVAAVQYHTGDRAWIEQLPWSPQHYPLLEALPGSACGQEILSYDSPLGKLWFTPRPGHTPGSVDLIIDVRGDPTNRVAILGSAPGGACALPPGVNLTLQAHGTAVIGGPRRAKVERITGDGINRPCLTSLSMPRPGSEWSVQVDVSQHPGALTVTLTGTDCMYQPGIRTPYGEILVNPLGKLLLSGSKAVLVDNPVLSFFIPHDPLLMGETIYVQGVILGGGVELCNGLKLTIGF